MTGQTASKNEGSRKVDRWQLVRPGSCAGAENGQANDVIAPPTRLMNSRRFN
jgi:hypothetical protein